MSVRKLARTATRSLREDGWSDTVAKARTFVGQRVLHVEPDFTQHRYALSERLCEQFDYRIAYGPLAGLQLDPQSWWSAADRGAMIIGCYEAQVLRELQRICEGSRSLIDVGAADGYYAVGAVKAGLVPRAFCFEMSAEGRAVIAANAEMNGVADRIAITGTADSSFLDSIPREFWSQDERSIFLFDIEGAEFDLLTADTLQRLRNSFLIVELHEAKGTSPSKADVLMNRAERFFQVDVITAGPRDPNAITELSDWSDDDRWLLMSESRPFVMRWLLLTPKCAGPASP